MTNSIYDHMLSATSQNLNMTRQHLRADTRKLAEYWEVALEHGNIDDVNTAILFLDTGIHGYLKARGIDLGAKKSLKRDRLILNSLILLIAMYVLEQPRELFPIIHKLTPMSEPELQQTQHSGDILEMAEKILQDKSEHES